MTCVTLQLEKLDRVLKVSLFPFFPPASPACFHSFVFVLDVIRIMPDTLIRDGKWPDSMNGQQKTN